MKNCIAVFMNENDMPISFWNAKKIIIFEKDNDNVWIDTNSIPIDIPYASDIKTLRSQINSIIKKLGDCRIIAGLELNGLPLSELNKAGFEIFDIEQINDTVFNGIIYDIEQNNAMVQMKKTS